MMKWLYRIVWIPVFLGAVVFLAANRTPVSISLDPFNTEDPVLATPEIFLWFWLILMLFIGVALGSIGTWLSGRETRVQARDNRREVKALKKELAVMTARAQALEPDPVPQAATEDEAGEPLKLSSTTLPS